MCQIMPFLLLFLGMISCAEKSYNIIDITDDQYIEDAQGNRCKEREMLINPDNITYLYENCPIRRVVKPKPHILPSPPKPKCTDLTCVP